MEAVEYERDGHASLPGFSAAECYFNHPLTITDTNTLQMEGSLRGSLFVSGRHGERYWGLSGRCRIQDFREVDDCHLSGHGIGEYRLRAGFLHLPLCYAGARHGLAIYRITHLAEMAPWKLGRGKYDRPIPRRIAEEAGVPRNNFGHRKLGGYVESARQLNPESEHDFQDFLLTQVPEHVRRSLDHRPPWDHIRRHRQLAWFRSEYSHWPLAAALLDGLGTDRLHQMWNSVRQYEFHWGFTKVQDRYRWR